MVWLPEINCPMCWLQSSHTLFPISLIKQLTSFLTLLLVIFELLIIALIYWSIHFICSSVQSFNCFYTISLVHFSNIIFLLIELLIDRNFFFFILNLNHQFIDLREKSFDHLILTETFLLVLKDSLFVFLSDYL